MTLRPPSYTDQVTLAIRAKGGFVHLFQDFESIQADEAAGTTVAACVERLNAEREARRVAWMYPCHYCDTGETTSPDVRMCLTCATNPDT